MQRKWEFEPAKTPWWKELVSRNSGLVPDLLAGVAGGLALGTFAHGYIELLHHIPATAEILRMSEAEMAKIQALNSPSLSKRP